MLPIDERVVAQEEGVWLEARLIRCCSVSTERRITLEVLSGIDVKKAVAV